MSASVKDLSGETLVRVFLEALKPLRLPEPVVREHKFNARRKWRMDFAWPNAKVALEVEGGIWTQGRHTRGAGVLADMDKYNSATAQGWKVFRCTPDTLCNPETLELLERSVGERTITRVSE